MHSTLKAYHTAGEIFAALINNVQLDQLHAVKAAGHTYGADADFGRRVSALAMDVLKAGEGEETDSFAIYSALSKEASWSDEHTALLDPFLEALAVTTSADRKAGDAVATQKIASAAAAGDGPLAKLFAVLGAGKKGYGDMFNAMLSAGLVGGLATGTAHWAMDQDIAPTTEKKPPLDAVIAAKEEERDYFRRVRQETENRMRRSLSLRNPERHVVSSLSYA